MEDRTFSIEQIQSKIFSIRDNKVILDKDLAEHYGVKTKYLNQIVTRNKKRFPSDYMFRLKKQEVNTLRLQFATLDKSVGRTYLPNAFTERGALMAATLLNSDHAIEMSIFIINAFVLIREALKNQRVLWDKINSLEKKFGTHDIQIKKLFGSTKRKDGLFL